MEKDALIHGVCPECGNLLIVNIIDLLESGIDFVCPNCKTKLDINE